MSVRVRSVVGFVTALAGLVLVAAPSGSASADDPYVFPSTNDANRELGLPHVNELSKGPGTVTLEFVNPTGALAFFEYRLDGLQAGTTPHPVVIGDVIHPGVCVEGDVDFDPPCEPDAITKTFSADATVEVRLALGGERDWDFDWTPFTVGADADRQGRLQERRLGGVRVPQPGRVHPIRQHRQTARRPGRP